MIARVIFSLLLFSSISPELLAKDAPQTPQASGGACCVCAYGDEPGWQIPFFKIGCDRWFKQHPTCTVKKKIPFSSKGLANACSVSLPQECEGASEVKVGFVGHWERKMTEPFLTEVSQKFCTRETCKLFVDNTACDVFPDPQQAAIFINTLKLLPNVDFQAQGPQCTSIGMNTGCETANLTCRVTRGQWRPEFRRCESYLGYDCSLLAASGAAGTCQSPTGPESIACCPKTTVASGGKIIESSTTYQWRYGSDCKNHTPRY